MAAQVMRERAKAVLRALATTASRAFGTHENARQQVVNALPALLRTDAARLFAAVSRIDVTSAILDVGDGERDPARIERALVTLWLGIAGHPGLAAPLILPGPFRESVVDPRQPRRLAFGAVRGIAATARGLAVLGQGGAQPIDRFVAESLPAADGTVIVGESLAAPPTEVAARVCRALAQVRAGLPGGRLERVTIGGGAAACGEARIGPEADPAGLVASAQAAFTRAAAASEPVWQACGTGVRDGRRLTPAELLARACGDAVALPWRPDRASAAAEIARDLDDLTALGEPTAAGLRLAAAVRHAAGTDSQPRRRALLVSDDPNDFVPAFQFARAIEQRCAERGLCVDRIVVKGAADLAAELGGPVPAPIADGTEVVVESDRDRALDGALRRFSPQRYEVVVANVRPPLFYDLLGAGLLARPTLLWDRHLHGGLREEGARRGIDRAAVRRLALRVWSLEKKSGPYLQPSLADAGFQRGMGQVWPIDLEFFRSATSGQPDRLFAGGENQRDWPLLLEAIRDLPLDVHLVTGQPLAALPPNARVDKRLPLWRFRDAMAAAALAAVPLEKDAAAGVTVIPMAMALGVAVVATRTAWTDPLITHGEDGWLVPPGDVGAFRHALVRLHEDTALRARLAANGRRRVAAQCDLEAFTRAMFAALG